MLVLLSAATFPGLPGQEVDLWDWWWAAEVTEHCSLFLPFIAGGCVPKKSCRYEETTDASDMQQTPCNSGHLSVTASQFCC
uniref:Uncharacterized protein n=1 Tax=Anguilla anguilla TaxID=7936 RepID=A0A0E9UCS4_ANGAN